MRSHTNTCKASATTVMGGEGKEEEEGGGVCVQTAVVKESGDSEGTTMGSAPTSPCLWEMTEEHRERSNAAEDESDRMDGGDKDGGRKRRSLGSFSGGMSSAPLSTKLSEPAVLRQSNSAAVKDTYLLAGFKTTPLHELEQSASPSPLPLRSPPVDVPPVLPPFVPSRSSLNKTSTYLNRDTLVFDGQTQ